MDNRRECSLANIASYLRIVVREPLGYAAGKARDESSGDECLGAKAAQAGRGQPEWIVRHDEINNVPTPVAAERALARSAADELIPVLDLVSTMVDGLTTRVPSERSTLCESR